MAFQIEDHNLISELQQRYLECNVCTEIFNENDRIPKILPCQHTFCLVCLNAIYRKGKIKCPTCNCLHILNKQEFIELRKDNTRRDLKYFLQIQGIHSQVCSSCSSENIHFVCKSCDQYFCANCNRLHKAKFSAHEIESVNMKKRADKAAQDVCFISGHDKSPLKYFCDAVSCKKVICANCVILDHRNDNKHDVIEINILFDRRKEFLRSAVTSLREHVHFVKVKQMSFTKQCIALHNQRKEFTKEVEITVEKGIQMLNARKIQILKDYSTLFQHYETKISNSTVQYKKFVESAEECCDISEQILLSTSIGSFLTIDEMMIAYIKELLSTDLDDIKQDDASKLQLIRNEKLHIENVLKGLDVKPINFRPESSVLKKRVCQSLKFLFFLPTRLISFCSRSVREPGTNLYKFWFEQHDPDSSAASLKTACKFFLMMCILLAALTYILPQTYYFKFETTQRSQFACRSSDNMTVSSYPFIPGMICGSPNQLFKYKGVFGTKRKFLHKYNIDVLIKIRTYYALDEDYTGRMLFEFGLTPCKDAKCLFQEETLLIAYGISCQLNTIGVCLTIANSSFVTDNLFIPDETSDSLNGLFRIRIRPNKASVSFIARTFVNVVLHEFTDIVFEKPLMPVFAAYENAIFSASLTILSPDSMQFDRTTLHPSLYISDDNKTFSNRPTFKTKLNNIVENPYVRSAAFAMGSLQNVITIVEIHFSDSTNATHGTKLFDLGFGYQSIGSFDESFKFECLVCNLTSYGFRGTGYCLNNKNSSIVFIERLRIIIHYNIANNKLSMLIPKAALVGKCYYAYTFDAFNGTIPQLSIGKHNVENILALFTDTIYLPEAVLLYLFDWIYS